MSTVSDALRERIDRDSLTAVNNVYRVLAALVLAFALWVRSLPADDMQYVQALDPYMIGRMAAAIAQNGFMPAVDVWRSFPFTMPTHILNLGDIYIPAYLFEFVRHFGVDFLEWAQLYPALVGGLAIVPVYLLVSDLYDRRTGVFSSLFLATSVAIMQRSSAGWFEKEPIANLLMLSSLYLFVTAWERTDWRRGIGSGLFLGIAATSWGGTQFMFLLYPLVVFTLMVVIPLTALLPVLMAGREFPAIMEYDGLFAAYAPTALIGTILPFILNGTAWSLPNAFFVGNMAALAFLALRYGAEKYELVDESMLSYLNPGMFVVGLIGLALAPLYSQTLTGYVDRFMSAALQSGGGTIAGTVAENMPAQIAELISQFGAQYSAVVLPGAQIYSGFFSGWTFSLIGLTIIAISVLMMLLRTYAGREEVNRSWLMGGSLIGVSSLSLVMVYAFYTARTAATGSEMALSDFVAGNAMAFLPSILIVTAVTVVLYLGAYLHTDEFEQWRVMVVMMALGLMAFGVVLQALQAVAVLGIVLGGFFIVRPASDATHTIEINWPEVILLLWIGSTLFGATQKSRLLFLAATPVAVVAGIAVSRGLAELDASRIWDEMSSVDGRVLARSVLLLFVVALVVVNVAAVYVMAEGVDAGGQTIGGIGGSPNQAWMDALTHFRDNTEPGSVLLSWWDYGYWFQSIANRPSVADGGNEGFYAQGNNVSQVNYELASFLTSENASEWKPWLESRGVDYIVLDSSMIGKYTAVSQIARRDNSDFLSMQTADCRTRSGRCVTSTVNNQTAISYEFSGVELLVPVRQGQGGDTSFASETPVMRLGRTNVPVANLCTSQGIIRVTEEQGSTGGLNDAITQSAQQDIPFGGCLAPHPYRGFQQMVVVPPAVMDHTIVDLYLMNGRNVPFAEPAFSNGYVRSWKVTE